jgi:hypothetical protein
VTFWTSAWAWVLLWVVLVLAAAILLALVARSLFRRGVALLRDLGAAAQLLGEVGRSLDEDAPSAGRTKPRRRPVPNQDVR